MGDLEAMIALASRHVTEGRRIGERQRALVAQRPGLLDAVELLQSFERSLTIFEEDLERLVGERDRGEERRP